ncbi:hypothetical protein HHK36_011706 [Tetracentron sinense]|uniref:Beta-Casp domain-containing protein n=1 Tax=Tetracentron sinense TaxID=13715 RepID=A0A834ZBJ6_TETSI|nr:hypothetical protein HHK36_011706 [Tetracentron sinense]
MCLSVADVKDCVQKIKTLKYAEEVCYNGTLIIKAFSSGLEIGTSNWTINGPRRNITCLSSSIFESAHAMNFDYHSLQGNDLILFSDFSSLHGTTGVCKDSDASSNLHACQASTAYDCSSPRDDNGNGEGFIKSLFNSEESLEEMEKLAFICSCAIDSVKEGGSVLIPIGHLGIVLQLVEQISLSLESANLKVPIFIISTIAEDILAFTNVVPEWLCEQRQQKLYSGEPLFAHVELIKDKKLHLFPAVYSPNLLGMWQEPCIVFSPHWSLRLGPVVHLLRRWCGDQKCLLVLEQGVDADLALLPFKPMKMKVLQCSFRCGIKYGFLLHLSRHYFHCSTVLTFSVCRLQQVQPLLEMLKPKFVLLPEELRLQIPSSNTHLSSFFYYTENETLRVPRLRDFFEADLAFQFQPGRLKEENKCLARLKGELFIEHGKHLFVLGKEPVDSSQSRPLLHWGSLDLNLLLKRLREKGINGSVEQSGSDIGPLNACLIHVYEPNKALIEIRAMSTIISAADETLASLIFEAVSSVLDGI